MDACSGGRNYQADRIGVITIIGLIILMILTIALMLLNFFWWIIPLKLTGCSYWWFVGFIWLIVSIVLGAVLMFPRKNRYSMKV